jgi:hypothetical protein
MPPASVFRLHAHYSKEGVTNVLQIRGIFEKNLKIFDFFCIFWGLRFKFLVFGACAACRRGNEALLHGERNERLTDEVSVKETFASSTIRTTNGPPSPAGEGYLTPRFARIKQSAKRRLLGTTSTGGVRYTKMTAASAQTCARGSFLFHFFH